MVDFNFRMVGVGNLLVEAVAEVDGVEEEEVEEVGIGLAVEEVEPSFISRLI